ncbi:MULTISPECIES: YnfA family protein [unclassified Thermosynechococcus]|uniref:YnfA family protein n=1 Tax=unclassified Thermosynechococcus TaxID=2622553 RepID=UPI00197F0A0F|nr:MULTISPECIES: YnfA family protein [unclassified Thermosynechococcus]QSF50533.1 YnfA family protein [Thermosynechococcus sp. TA-1]
MKVAKSLLYFLITGLLELGGAYLVWLWLREHKSIGYALAGAIVLFMYGMVPTLQPAHFGRVQAAYSGIFLLVVLFWGWGIDKVRPDKFDLLGAGVALLGTLIIMYAPRSH